MTYNMHAPAALYQATCLKAWSAPALLLIGRSCGHVKQSHAVSGPARVLITLLSQHGLSLLEELHSSSVQHDSPAYAPPSSSLPDNAHKHLHGLPAALTDPACCVGLELCDHQPVTCSPPAIQPAAWGLTPVTSHVQQPCHPAGCTGDELPDHQPCACSPDLTQLAAQEPSSLTISHLHAPPI